MSDTTRQRLLDAAADLFAARRYDAITLDEIIAAAGCPAGDAQRHFDGKESLALAVYQRLSVDFAGQMAHMDEGPVAERLRWALQDRLAQLESYHDVLAALFGAAMRPDATAWPGAHADPMLDACRIIVAEAVDAPARAQVESVASLCYTLHLLVLLFWLYDRTPDRRATHSLLDFLRDTLRLARPALALPPVSRSLRRLTTIILPVFGGGPDVRT